MPEQNEFDLTQEPTDKVPTLDKGTTLHRVLGIPQLFAIGYGDVGSSIYYALGVTALYALGATPLALALAGIVFICTVLTYAEMASALPEAGGSCSFARHAFNDLVSFIAGWALLLDYIVTIAISAFTVGPYLSYFFPILKTSIGNIPFTILVITTLLTINIIGVKESTKASLILCIFDILTQLAIILIGFLLLFNLPHIIEHMRIGVKNVDWSPTWPQFWKGVSMAMVAYIGIESIAQLGGEARDASHKVPRAHILTMFTLIVMYLGVSLVALSALHPRELSTTYLEDPIAGIVAALPIGKNLLSPWVGLLGATILFVAANAGLIGASRLTFSMGESIQLPKFFYSLHPRFRTPHISLIFFSVLAVAVVLVAGKLTFIADLYNFGAMLAFSLAHLSLIGLRWKKPEMDRPFKVPFNLKLKKAEIPITALIGFLGTLGVWIDVIISKPAGRNLGFVWMSLGIAFYFYYRHRQHLPASKTLEIEKLKIPEFHEIAIKKILVPTRGGAQTETVQFAAKVAKIHNAELVALFVIEIPPALPLDTFFPEKLLEADSSLERAQAISREYGINMTTHVAQSRSASETILEISEKENCDLIVLGTPSRKLSAPGRPILGSTIETVLNKSARRVWVCHNALK